MTVTGQNIRLTAGDARPQPIDIDAESEDLLDATARWVMRRSARGPVVLEKATGGDGLAIDSGAKVVYVTFAAADTEDLVGDFLHELEITSDGKPVTVTTGRVSIKRALVKP